MDILKILQVLELGIPTLAGIVEHYIELANGDKLPVEDADKAKALLLSLKLPDWNEIP